MKTLIKRAIPRQLKPIARRAFLRLFNSSSYVDLSKDYKALAGLEVLRCRVAYNKHGGYCVPLSSHHRPAAQRVLSNDVYEPETIEFILHNCNDGDIVHAGTYFGDFLPALSKGIDSKAKIWAFEPNPENFRCARITLAINSIENTVLANAGLGARQETLFVTTKDADGRALGGASRIVSGESNEREGTEAVEIVTIDAAVSSERTVSIIQLDVEGYEKEALTGALTTIRRCLPIIILEVLPHSTLLDSNWFSNNILSLGYRRIREIHGNFVYSCKPSNQTGS